MHVTVYHNEGPNHFQPFGPRSVLVLAAKFEVDATDPIRALNEIYEQLNVGGDMVPATEYTKRYRANQFRSLSVGDVVVLGETAWAVDRFGFQIIPTDALTDALKLS